MKNLLKAARCERKPLTIWDRQYILQMRERGFGIREIARKLGRNHSVVSRFLKSVPYSPYLASLTPLEKAYEMERRARLNRRKPRQRQRLKCHEIRVYVEQQLKDGLSPELAAGRLSHEHPELSTNYESIYQWIYKERRELIPFLLEASKNKRRKRAGSNKKRHNQPAAPKQSIEQRPKVVAGRNRFGDWEGDTIVSRQSTDCLLNLTERTSRYMLLDKLKDCSAKSGSDAMIGLLLNVPPKLRKTITLDNGPENAAHQMVKEKTGIEAFFCHPYTASERGTVENRNRFLRRFFPKKTDFSNISMREVNQAQKRHNHRPMKCLEFRTPHEVFWEAFKDACHA